MKLKDLFRKPFQLRARGTTNGSHFGYENPELVNSIKVKTKNYVSQIESGSLGAESFRTLAAIGLMQGKKQLNIIDFGGSFGVHQAVAKRLFPQTDFLWVVVETPELVRAISSDENRNGLYFHSTLEEAAVMCSKIDLVMANASIHYTANPLEKLAEIVGLGAEYIFITRTPLTNDLGSKQISQDSKLSSNGPGIMANQNSTAYVRYPAVITNRDEFESILLSRYLILAVFIEDLVTFTKSGEKFQTYGYFCRKLSANSVN
jgi:putative methyltransferase (TIGR04325 family)